MKAEISRRWRWLGIEFVVIALGVLAALFVDTWVEDRQNAERAEVYRQRLAIDLKRDISNLHAVTEYYSSVRKFGLVTLADLDGQERLDDFTLMHAAFNAAEEWAFVLESSTYNDLQNTGGLALISDVQFRIDLADYHRIGKSRENVWDLPRDFRAAARGIIPNALQTAIHNSCVVEDDAGGPLSAIETAGTQLPASLQPLTDSAIVKGRCGLNPEDFHLRVAVEELRSDPNIPRLLRYRISQLRIVTALFEGQSKLAQRLLDRLETSG